jgi:uncharacterized membrane protein HdeD (DUF308 family)
MDMVNQLTGDVKRGATWSIVLSVLMMVAGVAAIVVPTTAGIAVTVVVGTLLIFSAVLHLAFAFSGGGAGAVVGELFLTAAYGFAGYYILRHPVPGLEALTVAVAIYLFAESILEFMLSYVLRPAPGSGWLLFDGIVTALLAVLIASTWPSSSAWVVGTIVGISIFFSGLTRLMLSVAVRKAVA